HHFILIGFCFAIFLSGGPIFDRQSAWAESPDLSRLESQLQSEPQNVKLRSQIAQLLSPLPDKQNKIIELLNPYVDEIELNSQMILAMAFHQTESFDDEVRVLKKVITKNESNHLTLYKLGIAYTKIGDSTQATINFRKSIKLQKNFRPAYEALLEIFQVSKNNYESRAILREMERHFGKDPEIYSHLCRLDSLDGYIDTAIESCQLAIKLDPEFPDNAVYLSQSYIDQRNEAKAAQILLKSARRFPQSEFVQRSAGEYYLNQKNYAVAQKYFIQALKVDDKSSGAQLGLALCQFEKGMYEESLISFSKACKLDEIAIDKIRESSGKLRLAKETEWSRKFSQQIYKCKKK
ncbi:MAG: tetratricopeptide repeat protein, partial [Bdellovibrionales bacterium]|nr:tetratricopeptide repeat protein [Bdellovibrionales bacterium]